MLRDYALIREIRRKADAAIKRVAEKFARLADEDDFTSRLLQVIDDEFDGWSYNGVTWRTEIVVDGVPDERPAIAVEARKLTSRGSGAEEGKYGADIVMTVHVDVPGYRVAKSILIQSKRLDPDGWISRGEWDRLLGQIDRMRQMSEHSFVWMYSAEGVRSFTAPQLQHLEGPWPDRLYSTPAASLFADFIKSFYGDDRLAATDRQSLLRCERK